MRENHPDQHCIYAIDKRSVDYGKVKQLGEVVQYGSLKHWILYFTCQFNISSQKGGKPNAAVCSFIELNDLYDAHNIFLQHGVIINNVRWLYADRSRIKLFVTSAVPEQKYIEDNFGYEKGVVKLTGLPRFDNLHDKSFLKKKRILIMPSWRYWFKLKSKRIDGEDNSFKSSEYLIRWRELLESEKLDHIIREYGLEVIFYPHRNMQNFLDDFKNKLRSRVTIASWEDYDVQELLLSSSLMITDYSSVFFDMVYMQKPVIFYQFDIEKFRKNQYEEGYFNYSDNSFGESFENLEDVLNKLEDYLKSNYTLSPQFLLEHRRFFPLYDENNSERVYEEIMKLNYK